MQDLLKPFTNFRSDFEQAARDLQLVVFWCECKFKKMRIVEEKLSEAVVKYFVLYNKGSQDFKDMNPNSPDIVLLLYFLIFSVF